MYGYLTILGKVCRVVYFDLQGLLRDVEVLSHPSIHLIVLLDKRFGACMCTFGGPWLFPQLWVL